MKRLFRKASLLLVVAIIGLALGAAVFAVVAAITPITNTVTLIAELALSGSITGAIGIIGVVTASLWTWHRRSNPPTP